MAQIPSSAVSGGAGDVTQTDLTFPIDYNDAGAVDPPAEMVFRTQSQIDAWLAGMSATNFKHMDRAYRALPPLVGHAVRFELAEGVHRPSGDVENTNSAWQLTTKLLTVSGSITIAGVGTASYVPIVGDSGTPLAVTSYDAGSGGNPFVAFAGTPFAGLNLRGRVAILDNGQAIIIHDHDDSTLYVLEQITPAPADCWVGRPGSVLRNSQDDVAFVKTGTLSMGASAFLGTLAAEDVGIENFGGNGIILTMGDAGVSRTLRAIVDDLTPYEDFGKAPNGRPFQGGSNTRLLVIRTSAYACPYPAVAGNDQLLFFNGAQHTQLILWASYFGPNTGVILDDMLVQFRNCVFLEAKGGYGIKATDCALYFYQTGQGKHNEMRDSQGLQLINSECPNEAGFGTIEQKLILGGCIGPAVLIKSHCRVPLEGVTAGFIDGGGNLDVGIKVMGPLADVRLNAGTDVTGAGGDVEMGDGDILTYADIIANGPYQDGYGNIVQGV